MKKKIIGSILGVFISIVLLNGCQKPKQQEMPVPELLDPAGFEDDTTKVERRDVRNETIYVAEIVPEVMEMSFGTTGIIDTVNAEVGGKVKKGQVLATLEGTSDTQAIAEKENEIAVTIRGHKDANNVSLAEIKSMKDIRKQLKESLNSEKNKANRKRLQNQIIDQNHKIKIAKIKQEQMKELQVLEIAKLRKERGYINDNTGSSSLISPIDGEVITLNQQSGSTVEEGDTVLCLAVMDAPRVRSEFLVPDDLESSSYKAVINGKEYSVEAEVVNLSTEEYGYGYDESSIPDYTYFDFKDNKVDCKVGDFAVIHLQKDISINALSVPVNAVWNDKENNYIYVDENGAKVRRIIETGVRSQAYVEITSGVKEGEVVYVES
ncbi:MAG: hypothetical protein LBR68_02520 [Lachnoclostridium sp.]|jgi:multidrug efflux pump subunit AcrA (membrane-fusion protein)|nr:hypothetical protein [Lachnoclostridium sp.]